MLVCNSERCEWREGELHNSVSKHQFEVLNAFRFPLSTRTAEGCLYDRRLPLLNLEDAILDSVVNLEAEESLSNNQHGCVVSTHNEMRDEDWAILSNAMYTSSRSILIFGAVAKHTHRSMAVHHVSESAMIQEDSQHLLP
jgi:hypothetical protein